VAAWDVSFDVAAGEALGVIGESGSGKSTVMRCIAGDQAATDRAVVRLRSVDGGGTNILELPPQQRRRLRVDQLSVVYQDPAEGLDLGVTAGGNVAEPPHGRRLAPLRPHPRPGRSCSSRTEVPLERMDDLVGVLRRHAPTRAARQGAGEQPPDRAARRTDHRARRVASPPACSTSSASLLEELGIAAVVVSHDFAVIEMLTTRSIVMHHGRIVEAGLTDQLLEDPHHPYSQRLVAAARA
jgi:ABC-type phosphonate transport system ATPase subunit